MISEGFLDKLPVKISTKTANFLVSNRSWALVYDVPNKMALICSETNKNSLIRISTPTAGMKLWFTDL